MIKFPVSLVSFNNSQSMLSCFLNSAVTLFDIGQSNLNRAAKGESIKFMTDGDGNCTTAFYLVRHALELAIKTLIKEQSNIEAYGHDIEALWNKVCVDEHMPLHLLSEIKSTFDILKKYHLLNDEQLFRYSHDKKGTGLQDFIFIHYEDFSTIINCAKHIEQYCLTLIQFNR